MREEELIPGKYDIIVTSYEVVNKERAALRKFHWNFLIIDEAHKIKNENSILAQNVRLYKAGFRLLLTGTPLQNNLHELWALLNFLFPEVFTDAEEFDSWFKLAEGEAELSVIEQLHKVEFFWDDRITPHVYFSLFACFVCKFSPEIAEEIESLVLLFLMIV